LKCGAWCEAAEISTTHSWHLKTENIDRLCKNNIKVMKLAKTTLYESYAEVLTM